MIRVRGYEAVLPLEGVRGYRVYGQYEKRYPQPLYIRMGKFSHLSQKVKELYFTDGGYMIGCGEQSVLWVRRRHLFLHIGKELRLLCRCIRDHKYKIAVYRVLCHLVQPFLRKERWIVIIPDTKKYRREGSKTLDRAVFRSTVMPPDKTLLKGTRLPELTDELLGILKL